MSSPPAKRSDRSMVCTRLASELTRSGQVSAEAKDWEMMDEQKRDEPKDDVLSVLGWLDQRHHERRARREQERQRARGRLLLRRRTCCAGEPWRACRGGGRLGSGIGGESAAPRRTGRRVGPRFRFWPHRAREAWAMAGALQQSRRSTRQGRRVSGRAVPRDVGRADEGTQWASPNRSASPVSLVAFPFARAVGGSADPAIVGPRPPHALPWRRSD